MTDHDMDHAALDHRTSGRLVRAWRRFTYRPTASDAPAQRTGAAADHVRTAGPLPAGGGFARLVLIATTATIAALTFSFSFGNVWVLDLYLGIDKHIAPLVGPAVDLSVIGLLITVQWLALAGVTARQLRPARRLLMTCGLVTMALNSAPSLIQGVTTGEPRAYGRAAVEAIAPWLLIAWSHVGPYMLRLFVEVRQAVAARMVRANTQRVDRSESTPSADQTPQADVDQPAGEADQSARPKSNGNGGRSTKRSASAVHMVWSPTIRAMADHLDRHYRDYGGRPTDIPARRKVQAEMATNGGGFKWSSTGQVDQAIKAARSIREDADDDQERELAVAR